VIGLAELGWVARPERVAETTTGASIIGFPGFELGPAVCATAITAIGSWTLQLVAVPALLAIAAESLAARRRSCVARVGRAPS
jgi:hypothetical protein